MEWISIENKVPEKGKYILVETPYCKCPVTVARYTGVEFIGVDNKVSVRNVLNWMPLPAPSLKK